jgi:D-alanyl-D-alanine carboxypeptidase (penicillin-binding protein 5/6)
LGEDEPQDGTSELTALLFPSDGKEYVPPSREVVAERKRRRRIGGIIAIVAVVVVVALIATYVVLVLNAPIVASTPTVYKPTVTVPAAATIAMPQFGESAVSVAGADDYLGASASGILAASGGNKALPMASISKLVTAMVILNAKPLGASGTGPTITWTKAQSALYDQYFLQNATIAPMKVGTSMSERDAIDTMLVASACNYAEAMAQWAFGSDAAFLQATRVWLKAHGLTGTKMVESTGLNAQNVSTPTDLVALGKLAMANPAVAAIVGETFVHATSLGVQGMPSTNLLLGSDGVNGIKTGTLGTAEDRISNLLFSATVTNNTPAPLTVIGVVLGGESDGEVNSAVHGILTSLSSGFHDVKVATDQQIVGTYKTPWGSEANMILSKDASVTTWSNTPITSTMTTKKTLKSTASGQKVGSVTWTAGKNTVTVPVVLQGNLVGPGGWWRLTHPGELLGK